MEWMIFGSFAIAFLITFAISFIALSIIKRRRRAALFSGKIDQIVDHYDFQNEIGKFIIYWSNHKTRIKIRCNRVV